MKICCVKARDIPAAITGTTGAFAIPFDTLFADAVPHWLEREDAEQDTSYKQLIPYIITADAYGRFACYPRHGTEARLHGLYSCGIGGHIDETDKAETLLQTVFNGLYRELSEELKNFQRDSLSLHYKGIINEIDTSVGLVHLGIVFFAQCKDGYYPEAAAELAGLQWKTRTELSELKKEYWSDLAFELL